MKNCPQCNAVINDNNAFCTSCGYKFPVADDNLTQHIPAPNFAAQKSDTPTQPIIPPKAVTPPQAQPQQVPGFGAPVAAPSPAMPVSPAQPVNYGDPRDHTNEFSADDISKNKVYAMLGYLLGSIGVIIALLASNESKYTRFHATQALKFVVVNMLASIASIVLFWTILVPAAYGIFSIVLLVIRLICFVNVCSGKAKDAPIVSDLKFLN